MRVPLSSEQSQELYQAILSGRVEPRLPTEEETREAQADGWDGVALVWELRPDA